MSARPDAPSLELLVRVAELGSLSAAAADLQIAQPNASRMLARLERRLGTALIQRGPRGSVPTPAGRVAVDHARRVLDASDTLVEQVQAASGHGRLRMVASQTIAEHHMPRFLARLAADDPQTPVSLEVANTAGVLSQLRRGRADLGFTEGPENPEGFDSREIARDHLVAVVAPDHPWSRRGSVGADELAATPLVMREEGSGTRAALARALAPRTLASPLLQLHSNAAVRTAVAGGAGCALLSELAVREQLAAGSLVAVKVTGVQLARSLRAVWAQERRARLGAALQVLDML